MDGPAPPRTVRTVQERPTLTHAARVRAIVSTVAACGLVALAVVGATGGLPTPEGNDTRPQIPAAPAPWDYTTTAWDQALGGDDILTADDYRTLDDIRDPDLDGHDPAVRALARATALADLTGTGQDRVNDLVPDGIAPYWPDPAGSTPVQCTDVDLLAVAPADLPVTGPDTATLGMFTRYAKTLVAFTGRCADQVYDEAAPGLRYVYAGLGEDGWVPLRYWQVPAPTELDALPGATEPYAWELAELDAECTAGVVVRARIAVAEAFGQMCRAAHADGVPLVAVSGYRTRAEQAALYAEAVEYYGSPDAAGKHVAYADERVCTSKHCSGLAVNVQAAGLVLDWLGRTVGCISPDGAVTEATTCPPGSTPVPNRARWGFAAPISTSPGYLEFTVPLASDKDSSLGTANCAPAGVPVANQVAAIFRCRLAREGIVGEQADTVVAEALVVSRCESGWNPTAAAFGGRFATTAHPVTGRTYTHRGVFMIPADVAEAGWVTGGSAALTDPVANINAAASLWLTTRSWDQFGCATGAPSGFQAGPVLPQHGGPALPDWAFSY